MNTNYDLRELLSATPRDEGQGLTPQYSFGVAFYYSFIFLHFFVLLNMVIAIVVDAYMGAKGDQETEIAKRECPQRARTDGGQTGARAPQARGHAPRRRAASAS